MKIGASTACLCPMYTEDSLALLLEMGIRQVEIFFNTQSELDIKFIKEMKRLLDAYGGEVVSLHPYTSGLEPFMFFSAYKRRFDDMLDAYQAYFEAAGILGSRILVLHGDKLQSRLSDEECFERVAKIVRSGACAGVTVAHENVNLFRGSDPDFLRRLREYAGDEMRFVFDIKQAVRSGYDPYDFVQSLGDGVLHVHVNDNLPDRDCLLPGNGGMDYRRIYDILAENGCDPAWIVEVYRADFADPAEIAHSVEYLKKVLL